MASYLEDAPWPATKDELVDFALRTAAPLEVVENLQEIEEERKNVANKSWFSKEKLNHFARIIFSREALYRGLVDILGEEEVLSALKTPTREKKAKYEIFCECGENFHSIFESS